MKKEQLNEQKKQRKIKLTWNDLRCFITVLNVVLIIIYGLSIAWFGLAVAVLGIIKNLTLKEKMINTYVMYVANVALNVFFLIQLYCL